MARIRGKTMANDREILIVEDSRLQAETLARMLMQEGYAVRTASTGWKGFRCLPDYGRISSSATSGCPE